MKSTGRFCAGRPESYADDDEAIASVTALYGREDATVKWPDVEDGEEAGRDVDAGHPLGLSLSGEIDAASPVGSHLIERLALLFPVVVSWRARRGSVHDRPAESPR